MFFSNTILLGRCFLFIIVFLLKTLVCLYALIYDDDDEDGNKICYISWYIEYGMYMDMDFFFFLDFYVFMDF